MTLLPDHLVAEAIGYLEDYAAEIREELREAETEKDLHRAADIRRIIKSLQGFQEISGVVLKEDQ